MRFKSLILAVFVGLFSVASFGETPKLIVSIVIDQFRYDYLTRFENFFGKNGFNRLIRGGALMTCAHYNYIPTETGPGHSSYLSCTVPSTHGIIANEWYDRKRGRVYCVSDPTANTVGSSTENGKMSPKNFIGSTLADQLLMANNFHSKIVSLAIKHRAAILPAGKRPTGVFWFDLSTGDFITSSYYTNSLPPWVSAFNKKKMAEAFLGKKWEKLLPESAYQASDTDEGHGEVGLPGEMTAVFPHLIADLKNDNQNKRFDAFFATPFANQLTIEFSKAAIRSEKLGKGNYPDLLAISFSANDRCGHRFGPYSHEVQDITVRLDRQLGEFLDFLDTEIGLQHTLIILTSDHGVAPNPAYSKAMGLNGKTINSAEFKTKIEKALAEQYGPGKYILDFISDMFYLDYDLLKQKKLSPQEVGTFIGERATLDGDVDYYFTREQLLRGQVASPFAQLVKNGFNPERSGDLTVVPKPFKFFSYYNDATTHGTPYSYDTHIPIIFYGSAFKPGKYADEVYITDIVPTLCTTLKIEQPSGCIGKPIAKILK